MILLFSGVFTYVPGFQWFSYLFSFEHRMFSGLRFSCFGAVPRRLCHAQCNAGRLRSNEELLTRDLAVPDCTTWAGRWGIEEIHLDIII